jgi:DNA invertase Pin-like site-specific DNA recombinase
MAFNFGLNSRPKLFNRVKFWRIRWKINRNITALFDQRVNHTRNMYKSVIHNNMSSVRKQSKPSKLKPPVRLYNNYSDFTREAFIDRMLENPQERGLVTKVAEDLNINYRTALRWWNYYKDRRGCV